jgi:hypothetical protein
MVDTEHIAVNGGVILIAAVDSYSQLRRVYMPAIP